MFLIYLILFIFFNNEIIETTKNDWTIVHLRRDESPPSYKNRKPPEAISPSRKDRVSGALERHGFRTVVWKTQRINSCTCLREYIHNIPFSHKYLIAEFSL